jgi:hypothetical protein
MIFVNALASGFNPWHRPEGSKDCKNIEKTGA